MTSQAPEELVGELERRLRLGLEALFAFGCLGTLAELWLLEHTESRWQWAPLVLLIAGLVILAWRLAAPKLGGARAAVRAFQGISALYLPAGAAGLWLHYRGNAEFALELTPGLGGLELVVETLTGATPALAPGAMVLLGLIGLLSTLGDPNLHS